MTGDAQAAAESDGNWPVLAAVSLSTMLVMGSTTYAFGLFVKPIGAEFGIGRADVNLGAALMHLLCGALGPVVGKLIDAWPASRVMLAGTLCYAIGAGTIAVSGNLLVMATALLFVSAGMLAAGILMANAVALRWFRRRRGLAMVVTAIGQSAGGAIVVPLLGAAITAFGWRAALAGMAGIALVVLSAIALLVVRDPPEARAARTEGAMEEPEQAHGWRVSTLLRSRNFWMMSLGIALVFGIDAALLATLVPYGTDRGFSVPQAALLVSALTSSAIAGKLIIAVVADRFDRRLQLMIVIAFNLIFVGALLAELSAPLLIAACCIVGLSVGGTAPLWYALAADCFSTRSYGLVLGMMQIIVTLVTMAAIRFVGQVYDQTGSYDLAFKVFLAGSALAVLCVAGIAPPDGKADPAARRLAGSR